MKLTNDVTGQPLVGRAGCVCSGKKLFKYGKVVGKCACNGKANMQANKTHRK
ncbi:hypothetical protein [Peptostreptococcus faecalis]|uniref:hypothetical protein n=1 Tax=Peptostreptococcus faecalis TaxID=2045015 RepID=UPI0015E11244|nr:hypothetical protein [Peptostreptococcus faecalis]